MNLTTKSLANPPVVAVGVAIAMIFGLYSLSKLPVQLFPEIDRPQLSIRTSWRAASPQEIESEILEPQEEVLQGLLGMKEIVAEVSQGSCNVNLTFGLETDMQQTLIEVISRLNRVPPLPADADPPVVQLGGGGFGGDSSRELVWYYVQLLPGNDRPIESYQKLLEDVVKPRLETVPGVSGIQVMAGAPEEVQIRFDPYRAAELGIDLPRVAAIAGRANDVSGGFVVAVLWWFLRKLRATLVVATAIPLSLAGTFILLNVTGRSLNVISLAGLAFAVGMVLNAAIVVLENVVRLRERGRAPFEAAAEGTSQVWGALLASTATTVAIFR